MYPLLLLLISSVFLATEGQLGPNTETALASKDQIKSVEFNLAELSPRGPQGGYAMPASGSSHPDITFQRLIAGGSWNSADLTITAGDELSLKWNSTNANRGCEATAGTGFQTGHNAGGIDHSITEPTAGNSETYTVRCKSRIYCVGKDCHPTYTDYHETESISITTRNPAPTATLEQRINDTAAWSESDVTIISGDDIRLKWSSTNASSCTGSGGVGGFSTGVSSTTSGVDDSILEPGVGSSATYTVTCTGSGGSVSDSITVTKQSPPTVTMETQVGTGTWSTNNYIMINITDEVSIKWSSTDSTSCTGTGSGFNVSNTSGTDTDITEPGTNSETTYTVTCTGPGGSTTKNIILSTLLTLPTLTLTPDRIQSGQNSLLNYDPMGHTNCFLTGPNLPVSFDTPVTISGSYIIIAATESQNFTLTCPSASVSATLTVISVFVET